LNGACVPTASGLGGNLRDQSGRAECQDRNGGKFCDAWHGVSLLGGKHGVGGSNDFVTSGMSGISGINGIIEAMYAVCNDVNCDLAAGTSVEVILKAGGVGNRHQTVMIAMPELENGCSGVAPLMVRAGRNFVTSCATVGAIFTDSERV